MCCIEHLMLLDVQSEPVSTELQQRIESNKLELDRYLGVYPYDRFLSQFVLCCTIILYMFTVVHSSLLLCDPGE